MKVNGDKKCAANFMWQDMPQVLVEHCVCPITSYLALREQVESKGESADVIYGGKVTRREEDRRSSVKMSKAKRSPRAAEKRRGSEDHDEEDSGDGDDDGGDS